MSEFSIHADEFPFIRSHEFTASETVDMTALAIVGDDVWCGVGSRITVYSMEQGKVSDVLNCESGPVRGRQAPDMRVNCIVECVAGVLVSLDGCSVVSLWDPSTRRITGSLDIGAHIPAMLDVISFWLCCLCTNHHQGGVRQIIELAPQRVCICTRMGHSISVAPTTMTVNKISSFGMGSVRTVVYAHDDDGEPVIVLGGDQVHIDDVHTAMQPTSFVIVWDTLDHVV